MTGFLLTAIPNWTGRLPLQGTPLLILVVAWAAGRAAVTMAADLGALAIGCIDSAFLVLVTAAIAREIVAGRNWRNLKVVGVVAVLAIGNIAFHLEQQVTGAAIYSAHLAIAAVITLVMLIGGRIIPSFTRNWLVRENPGRLPAPFGRFDMVAIAAGVGALMLWAVAPIGRATGAALALAALLHAIRLIRWAGLRTWREPLVLVLHVGYAFVPLGFALTALAALEVAPSSAGVHAFAAGAFGTLTLAVMTRATLGHTGHDLTASPATQFIYAAIVLAAVARIVAGLEPHWSAALLDFAALAWIAAFLGFCVIYGAPLWGARKRKAV